MTNEQVASTRGGSWTKVAIFISLYVLLLESVIELALVLYLYGNGRVDRKMTPSLILALVASFLTLPLVVLHSLLAWQYNKVPGFGGQKTILRAACTYLLRVTVIIWLAVSVAGLVVISQQVSCLPETAEGSFWNTGVSCALHRTAVIVSIISFITACLYFCSRELCERPYDVSILGVYKRQQSVCDESIFSNSSLESDTLKDGILYLCPGPSTTYGARDPYWPSSTDHAFEKLTMRNFQYPLPIHQKQPLRPDESPESENTETLSGSTVTHNGALINTNLHSISRTSTFKTSRSISERHIQTPIAELSSGQEDSSTFNHKRQKSSLSSLRKYLPKAFPLSLPLSADPQIRALADSNTPRDVEKQTGNVILNRNCDPEQHLASSTQEKKVVASAPVDFETRRPPNSQTPHTSTLARPTSSNSSDAPEVVLPAPLKVQRSNTTHTAPIPRTIHRHRPSYTIVPPNPLAWHPVNRVASHRASVVEPDSQIRHNPRPKERQQSRHYQFEQSHVPRHTRSYHQPHSRYNYRGRYEPRRMSSQSRRSDIEIHYPSTRRPRSTTCGGLGSTGALDSIRESGASVDETRDTVPNANTYRGAHRTSMAAL
ncbi:hypothetical protein BDV38DRAFT_285429 [Aspergillus pseudotamarii]|uniref:Uncharacterized protein n=1 Tax=Aspergillus pseudotamarii TaxID=132259 RepID=A0A5N6SJI7_ASPPS|nr:uncharacterized protein BDV38DRAFT_285429 [Aspergillus pseudotamarii]KAE8134852.1 hypothetical protein BDV38DRAFT_285429 [Aspergillus pseudotamarii]